MTMSRKNGGPIVDELPTLESLHERHFGFHQVVCHSFAQAARVCLARHHVPPTDFDIENRGTEETAARRLEWNLPDARERATWNNRDDATRDGAYSIAIAVVEAELELFAVSRAETRTGADYLLGQQMEGESDDLEAAYRLEVAGDDRGELPGIRSRLKRKVQQAKDGDSDLPALACVVGFAARTVMLEMVGPEHGK
jgi:hypothetical protein